MVPHFCKSQDVIILYFDLCCSKKAVQDVLDQKKMCILDIEMQGVQSVRKTSLKPVYVFIKPPSMTVLVSDHRNAGCTECEED